MNARLLPHDCRCLLLCLRHAMRLQLLRGGIIDMNRMDRICPYAHVLRHSPAAACSCVTGTVRLQLLKGNIIITGRKSPYSLYDEAVASFEDDKGMYNQASVFPQFLSCSLPLPARLKLIQRSSVAKMSGY
eukprot:scaffold3862_cov16-Tisochrysis_lutea.AAC.2